MKALNFAEIFAYAVHFQ